MVIILPTDCLSLFSCRWSRLPFLSLFFWGPKFNCDSFPPSFFRESGASCKRENLLFGPSKSLLQTEAEKEGESFGLRAVTTSERGRGHKQKLEKIPEIHQTCTDNHISFLACHLIKLICKGYMFGSKSRTTGKKREQLSLSEASPGNCSRHEGGGLTPAKYKADSFHSFFRRKSVPFFSNFFCRFAAPILRSKGKRLSLHLVPLSPFFCARAKEELEEEEKYFQERSISPSENHSSLEEKEGGMTGVIFFSPLLL